MSAGTLTVVGFRQGSPRILNLECRVNTLTEPPFTVFVLFTESREYSELALKTSVLSANNVHPLDSVNTVSAQF